MFINKNIFAKEFLYKYLEIPFCLVILVMHGTSCTQFSINLIIQDHSLYLLSNGCLVFLSILDSFLPIPQGITMGLLWDGWLGVVGNHVVQAWRKPFYGGTANFMMTINCVGGTVTKLNDTVICIACIYVTQTTELASG